MSEGEMQAVKRVPLTPVLVAKETHIHTSIPEEYYIYLNTSEIQQATSKHLFIILASGQPTTNTSSAPEPPSKQHPRKPTTTVSPFGRTYCYIAK
jgi:hypothetical protein